MLLLNAGALLGDIFNDFLLCLYLGAGLRANAKETLTVIVVSIGKHKSNLVYLLNCKAWHLVGGSTL